ncbi:MAG: hypothetical protein PHG05_00875 [Candidatus Nanoarchaeia archaeon]|nr:hypothetical protein [Candidatus Nanoarchaeia archaeon]
MKRSNLIPLCIAVIPITVLIVTILYNYYVILDYEEIPLQIKVADNLGFDIDSTYLNFGTIPPGNIGSKSFVISNLKHKNAIVSIKIKGDLKDWIYVSENNFKLREGESKEIELKILVPKDTEKTTYQSRLIIMTTRF